MARDVKINIGATNQASAVLKKVLGDVKRFGNQAGSAMKSAGAGLAKLGAGVTGIGATAGVAFAGMTRTFAAFDDQMAKVAAVSGATGDELVSLREKAKELGATTAFSATEAAEGMEFLGMAGFKTNEILAGIGPTLALAAAGGVELGEAADIASDVGTAFGLAADEIGRVADVIAQTATSANTNVLMMGESFSKLAPIAKQTGQSIEETSAAIGLLANAGVKASEAGTATRNILMQLALPEVQKKLEDLGAAVRDDVTDEFLPLMDILRNFDAATANMSGPEKLALQTELFGKRSSAAVGILSTAGDEIDNMRATMDNAEGAASRMAETMMSGLGGAGVQIKSAFEGLQIAIIEGVKEPLIAAANSISSFLRNMTQLVAQNPQLVRAALVAGAAITALGVTLVTVGGLVTAFGLALTGLSAIAGAVGSVLAVVFSPVGIAIGVVLGLVTALGAALVVATVRSGALVDVFAILKNLFNELVAVADQTFIGIKNALGSGEYALAAQIAMAGVKVAFFTGLQAMWTATMQVLPKIFAAFQEVFIEMAKAAMNTMNAIARTISNPFAALEIGMDVIERMTGAGKGIGAAITDGISASKAQAQAELDKLTGMAAAKSFEIPAPAVGSAIVDAVEQSKPEVADAMADVVAPDPAELASKIKSTMEGIDMSQTPLGKVAGFVGGLFGGGADVGVPTATPAAIGPAGPLSATTGRLLSGGASKVSEELKESRKQTELQKQTNKILSENFNNMAPSSGNENLILDFNSTATV